MRSHTRSHLALQPLEAREVPAGKITAVLSPAGLLMLTGDDAANVVTLQVTGGGMTLTPDATTAINDKAAGTAVPFGAVTSIKADLKGGADTLSIDAAAAFGVSGMVSINLGDGDNTLKLATTGMVNLGGLTVTGGDGSDTVTVKGGVGSTVGGTAKLTYANGGSSTTLDGVTFAGVTIKAGDAIGIPNEVTGTNATVTKAFSAALGNSFPGTVALTGGSYTGGISVSGYSLSTLLKNTTVTKAVTVKGGYDADVQVDGVTVTGNVAVTAPNANFSANGTGSTVTGTLNLTGSAWTSADFASTSPTEVKGNITVKGGWFSDSFTANGNFKAGKNVSLNLGDGDNRVSVGDATALVSIGGKLTVQTGAGKDTVELDRVSLAGTADLKLGAGTDTLSIEDGTTFAKTFKADLGTGDDTISVAQNSGVGPVTFTGKATILAGTGNDTLFLGVAIAAGGDATTRVVFSDATSVVDGGLGLNDFDQAGGQFTPVPLKGW